MFEKISGFFKQFTRRRKRQSGETTIMESQGTGADEFGLDAEFSDTGDEEGYAAGDLDLDTFGDTGEISEGDDFSVGGDFASTEGFADTVGVGDLGAPGGDVSAQIDSGASEQDPEIDQDSEIDKDAGIDSEPSVEDAFSDFDITGDDARISTGGTDFDERTVSDEISGETGGAFDEARTDFDAAFDVDEKAAPMDAGPARPRAVSPVRTILTVVIAAVVAIGGGAAFQMFAWEYVSQMVGLAAAEEVQVDPQTQLDDEGRKKGRLTKELGEYKKIGSSVQVQNLKNQIAETRDVQGPMEEFEVAFEVVVGKETVYDDLLKRISGLEADIEKIGAAIENVRVEIEETKERVILLASRTEEEYERFRFELTRAELGQRLLIELQLRDIASFKADVAKLEQRLSKLSAKALSPIPVAIASPEEPVTTETFEN